MTDTGLATLSDQLMVVMVLVYSLALLGYAAQLAFGRREGARDAGAAGAADREELAPELVAAGALADAGGRAGSGALADEAGERADAAGGVRHADQAEGAARADGAERDEPAERAERAGADRRGRAPLRAAAVALTVLGVLLHAGVILTRGLAVGRLPWGNMYEFVVALAFGAVVTFLYVAWRYRALFLGLFVMIPVVLGLGLAATAIYTSAGPLMPALQHSYWIAIHVTAAITATGAFTVAAAATAVYLLAARYSARVAAGRPVGFSGIAAKLPAAEVLDRIAYRTAVFAFPIWTFAVIAGAMWADQAWGRYWGWDPKEVWSFIAWVVYAGYLHARATAGWRGGRAATIHLLAFGCLLFNLIGVNIWFSGLHSYSDVG